MNTRKMRVKDTLLEVLKKKTVIVGIGNTLKGDDAFGPLLIERLSGKIDAVCIDAGTAPENYAGKITKENPDTVLLVDAADLDLAPGEYDILRKDELLKSGFTTHDLSPVMFIEFLEGGCDSEIYMLGVQPERVGFGEEVTESVKEALNEIENLIMEVQNA